MFAILFVSIFVLALIAFQLARRAAWRAAGGDPSQLHSRPVQHGTLALLWVLIAGWGVLLPGAVLTDWAIDQLLLARIGAALPDAPRIERQLILSDVHAIVRGGLASSRDALRLELADSFARLSIWRIWGVGVASLAAACGAAALVLRGVSVQARARNRAERILRAGLIAMAAIAVLTTVGIVFSLIFETANFFANIGWRIDKFLFGSTWSPLSGVSEGRLDPERIGALPLFAGTALITLIAMLVAVPVGLLSAIYLSEFASPRLRGVVKPVLELLAGIPTVVYGFFAVVTIAPALRRAGEVLGLPIASESALTAGLVMGIMIIPFISSLSDDVINAVPQALRDGSYGLGANRAETIRLVVLPAALPGIVSAVLLGVSRAIGETMIVVMAAGQGANLTANPLEAVTTVTVQIVMLITGDTEATTAAGPAFTLGFTLFCVTLLMNIVALRFVRRYRELYD